MLKVSIAHSPDADDYFLFWPLRKKLIESRNYDFSFAEEDTEVLNSSALRNEFDICAVSLAVYPQIKDNYLILPHGASVGRNFGPTIISKRKYSLPELNEKRVGIPGKNTTSALVFSMIAPGATTIEVPLRPYDTVFKMLERNEIDAAVVIHEGQIDYSRHDCELLLDIGKWWHEKYGLPVPLGINVINRRLGKNIDDLSSLLREAIHYAQENVNEIIPELFTFTQTSQNKLASKDKLENYLSMYANEDSAEMKADVIKSIEILIGQANVEFSK
ncbi:MAG: hypothetical protein KBC84_05580 [Proteobacteria bacterium]|nr:hypothetical protein [Pseudomonadota bacterium]